MTTTGTAVRIPAAAREAMLVHAHNCYPEEACGLIATDSNGRLRMVYPLTNQLASPTNYTVEPTEHFRALQHAERQGWELTGVFHSHPHTDAYPSPTDIQLAPDPEWLYVLISLREPDHPDIRGFWIREGRVTETPLTT